MCDLTKALMFQIFTGILKNVPALHFWNIKKVMPENGQKDAGLTKPKKS